MAAAPKPPAWQTLLAFAIIYFVWGSTFLAIRVGVREVPPFLLAALRFLIAGMVLFVWTMARRERMPTAPQWASATLIALLIFVGDYGLLFCAEQRVPSGVAAVMLATIPAFMALAEILLLRTQRLTARLSLALLIGLCGVAVLVSSGLNLGSAPIGAAGAITLLVAAVNWSLASALSRKLPMPEVKTVSSAAQMLMGGVLLAVVSAALREPNRFHPAQVSSRAWLSLAYLTVAGSIVGFTAYVWLLHHQPPTRVGTYAYVNPVVAVIVGYFFGGEALGLRTALGTLLVLASVIVIVSPKRAQPAASCAADAQCDLAD
jgi:drug/metabolite transporter (DMT)-like permease